jgi:hypothetical protein
MTNNVNADSVLTGNFCDIVKFFRGRAVDETDRLAQRALSVILKTNHLVQTGDEVDADPFSANWFASTALESALTLFSCTPAAGRPSIARVAAGSRSDGAATECGDIASIGRHPVARPPLMVPD